MADTSTFMPVGELPMIDYGAVYRNAKARRELEEEKEVSIPQPVPTGAWCFHPWSTRPTTNGVGCY
jgi:hypothetical protein